MSPISPDGSYIVTTHALRRLQERGLPLCSIDVAFRHGRPVWTRGAQVWVVGRREVEDAAEGGIDLRRWSGLNVVCSPEGVVLTVYRNHDFRALKPRSRRPHLRRPVSRKAA